MGDDHLHELLGSFVDSNSDNFLFIRDSVIPHVRRFGQTCTKHLQKNGRRLLDYSLDSRHLNYAAADTYTSVGGRPLINNSGYDVSLWTNQTSIFGSYNEDETIWTPADSIPTPVSVFPQIMRELGSPDLFSSKPGGCAIWLRPTLQKIGKPFDRIEIRDEQVPHGNPANHAGFVYAEYSLKVPSDIIDQIRALSGSITYDPLAQRLRVRSHSLGVIKVVVFLAIQIASRAMSLPECVYKIQDHIAETIDSEDNPLYRPEAESEYEGELLYHLQPLPPSN